MSHKLKTVLVSEFALLVLVAVAGAFLLMNSRMHTISYPITFVDALFTTTSALTVTGLTVVPTGTAFTQIGKALILFLIEIGGIGIVVIGSLFEMALLKRTPHGISYVENQTDLTDGWHRIPNILFFSIKFILISQLIGFLALWLVGGMNTFDALFHSISAYNNAGFSTYDTNLLAFSNDWSVLAPISILIFLGSVGFLTIAGLYRKLSGIDMKLSTYTKLLLRASLLLYSVSTVLLFIDLVLHHVGVREALSEAVFQSITFRTAGFNTIDFANLGILGIFTSLIMMAIGGGSISMAGGMKVSTVYVFVKNVLAHLQGKSKTYAIKNKYYIPSILVETSYFIVITYGVMFLISLFLLALVEDKGALSLTDLSFEIISALSTVGLTVGITTSLTVYGKLIIIIDMMVGRLGVYVIMRKIFQNITRLRRLRKQTLEHEDLKELEIAVG